MSAKRVGTPPESAVFDWNEAEKDFLLHWGRNGKTRFCDGQPHNHEHRIQCGLPISVPGEVWSFCPKCGREYCPTCVSMANGGLF